MTIPNSVYQTAKVAEDRVASRQSVDHRASINAAVESNKSMFRQMLEYYRIRKTPGHLLMKDYFKYRLYDYERYTFEEKCQFVSDTFYHQTIRNCCDPRWWILADDKFWSYQLLSLNGMPVPETQAVIQNGTRDSGIRSISRIRIRLSVFRTASLFPTVLQTSPRHRQLWQLSDFGFRSRAVSDA